MLSRLSVALGLLALARPAAAQGVDIVPPLLDPGKYLVGLSTSELDAAYQPLGCPFVMVELIFGTTGGNIGGGAKPTYLLQYAGPGQAGSVLYAQQTSALEAIGPTSTAIAFQAISVKIALPAAPATGLFDWHGPYKADGMEGQSDVNPGPVTYVKQYSSTGTIKLSCDSQFTVVDIDLCQNSVEHFSNPAIEAVNDVTNL